MFSYWKSRQLNSWVIKGNVLPVNSKLMVKETKNFWSWLAISSWESADTVTNFFSLITDWPRNSGTTVPVNTLPIGQFNNHKVHIFWEGHKIFRILPLTFEYSTYVQSIVWGGFCKILWPSQNIWTLKAGLKNLKHPGWKLLIFH